VWCTVANPIDRQLEELIAEEYPGLLATAYLIVHDEDGAREVVQESFARLIERWERVRDYEKPGAWLRTVTVRQSVRRRDGRRREPVTEIVDGLGRNDQGPAAVEGAAARLDVVAALRLLPAGQREVVALYYLHDLSTEAIAADLGRRPGTIRAQLHQARSRLSALLDQEVPDGAR
jgi:RNA polymerase sigma-70 factor (ECF subfamily)